MVANLPRHLVALERFIGNALGESEKDKVRFVLADDLAGMFADRTPTEATEKIVKGWRVKSTISKSAVARYLGALNQLP